MDDIISIAKENNLIIRSILGVINDAKEDLAEVKEELRRLKTDRKKTLRMQTAISLFLLIFVPLLLVSTIAKSFI